MQRKSTKFKKAIHFNTHDNFINNKVSDNEYGIYIESSNDNTITGNNASRNNCGIRLSASNGNMIVSNVIYENFQGLNASSDSVTNSIYHNNFTDNMIQAFEYGGNTWHNGYPSGGNYWSDYSGSDVRCGQEQSLSDPDGIGDSPYESIIGSSEIVDQYPLKYPYAGQTFTIVLSPGWNLISIPTQEANWNVPNVLASISGLYDLVQTYDSISGTWKLYSTLSPPWVNTLKTMNATKGYWIHVTATNPIPLHLYGARINEPMQVQLFEGWNLIGYPKMDWSRSVSTVMVGIPWDLVQIGDQTRLYNLRTIPGTYIMRPHRGYWIHVTEDCTWCIA